jgi:hypothetical protein
MGFQYVIGSEQDVQKRLIKIEDIIDYLDTHNKLKEIDGWIDAGIGRVWN